MKQLNQRKKIKIINYLINPITINQLLRNVFSKKNRRKSKYICVSNVHSCIESFLNNKFKIAHNLADLALPDGRPIYWLLKFLTKQKTDHLPGYYITEKICYLSAKKGYKIGFIGSTDVVLDQVDDLLKKKYENLIINYKFSLPFKKISSDFNNKIVSNINKSKIDILFVCLGCPKQEFWMYNNKNKIKCTMIGIGAAIDFISKNKILPNKFFEKTGLGWFIRFLSEPRRLFWRYFKTNLLFIFLIIIQLTNIKRFK